MEGERTGSLASVLRTVGHCEPGTATRAGDRGLGVPRIGSRKKTKDPCEKGVQEGEDQKGQFRGNDGGGDSLHG